MFVPDLLAEAARHRVARNDAEAEACYRRILAEQPDQAEALRELGAILQLQGRYADAIAVADTALKARPGNGLAWLIRGDAHLNAGEAEAALPAYERAAKDTATRLDATIRTAKANAALKRFTRAALAFDKAVAMNPDGAAARHDRGLFRLANRAYAEGWRDYEARWRLPRFIEASRGLVSAGLVQHLALTPTRETLAGRRVLVVGEQAIGDQVMFASLLPDLQAVASHVICICEPRLIGLFRASFPGVEVLHPSNAQVDADVLVAMGSLGGAFRPDEASFPGEPYLRPTEPARARWAERLGPKTTRLRVGLSWRGGAASTRRLARSIELAELAPRLETPDCEFVNLQYGDVQAEVDAVNARLARPVRSFPAAELNDFDDLAGLVSNLDMVVSVQTTLVHLTGALGGTCVAMLPDNPEWRYTTSGETMPWYRSVRLVRQTVPGEWGDVIERVADVLRSRAT